ncbi:twin-arginine translocase TatA/TatE family subunit [Sedimentibacter hydroxybenzoicus DSM 7310]|uniref:Sec-independent protein translocase protein TatA n=1 Tax=Sedimentibacter hydroxybenzoicus DSM 7310 TaxID=1123245 RepID=A0A974BLF7_SEDHY|nr:twin-arginine translocase TatA/TatE family subunit [Sedimentibacter hydroxybenzoicus]NYB75133.1 twin-arginine translocase TatA/TatE family subunit [Sedimentibacter hydroxybenzoicus DSM 7310]
MGRLGPGELILLLAIALVIFGPSKLPELGKSLGRTVNEFKKFSNDLKVDVSLDENKPTKTDKKEDKNSSKEKLDFTGSNQADEHIEL